MLSQEQNIVGTVHTRLHPGVVSAAVHILVLLLLAGVLKRAPKIAPYKLPGTAKGNTLLTYYASGSPNQAASAVATKSVAPPQSETHLASSKPAAETNQALHAERGSGVAAQSGLGDGEISMALLTHFPHPKPDLSSLAHGVQGDVVLNAVIDEHGKISDLTLIKGLGQPIDDQVIAVVREWTYSPATRNGTPVPSEQELHFHYERG